MAGIRSVLCMYLNRRYLTTVGVERRREGTKGGGGGGREWKGGGWLRYTGSTLVSYIR